MQVISIGECMVELREQGPGLWHQGFAGDTMNVAWALRALLPPETQVTYQTMIGTDRISDQMFDFLASADLDTRAVLRHPSLTVGLYAITTDEAGERQFTYWRSSSAARHLADDPHPIRQAILSADLFYLSGITLAILAEDRRAALLEAIGSRTGRNCRIAFDPNIRLRLWNDIDTMRAAVTAAAMISDIVLPTFDDESAGFNDATPQATLDRYAALGAGEIVVKDGTRPTHFLENGRLLTEPVRASQTVLDTTGAGDSFNGSYLAARLRGMDQTEAVRRAHAVAARVVRQRGALCKMDEIRAAFSDNE